MQEAQVRPPIRELDPTCHNKDPCSQINILRIKLSLGLLKSVTTLLGSVLASDLFLLLLLSHSLSFIILEGI